MKKPRLEFRLIPVVVLAAAGLFTLKALGVVFDGGYTLGQRLGRTDQITVTTVPANATTQLRFETTPLDSGATQPQERKTSWMRQMFNYPDGSDGNIVTGSVHGAPAPAKDAHAAAKTEPAAGKPETKPAEPPAEATAEPPKPVSAAERSILERLQQRRQELDARTRELEMRENLLKAQEQKLETRDAGGAKSTEARANPANPAPKSREDVELARFKGLVTMYETMKPKDAAKIFDRLDMKVLLEMASQIKPQRMSEILALMSAETAERLTVEMASRSGSDKDSNPNDLPKIDGRPGAM